MDSATPSATTPVEQRDGHRQLTGQLLLDVNDQGFATTCTFTPTEPFSDSYLYLEPSSCRCDYVTPGGLNRCLQKGARRAHAGPLDKRNPGCQPPRSFPRAGRHGTGPA
jgi:hypothetical protein